MPPSARKEMRSLVSEAQTKQLPQAESFAVSKSAYGNKPMQRKQYRSRGKPFMAYDLETSRIAEGTPLVKYITCFCDEFKLSETVKGRDQKHKIQDLCDILTKHLLVRRFNRWRFVAWNGNGFDVFFIAMALLQSDDYIVMPYLTRSKSIRGMRVVGLNDKDGMEWEFLDGMSMTGLDTVKMKLSKFVEKFAPQYPKLELDFSQEEFNPRNKKHVAYAERDSEALYYAMLKASSIVRTLSGCDLQPTMGNLAIKYFQSKMPKGVMVWKPSKELREILHGPVKRGGYCWIARQYAGPIWKYDLNQAYAAAMRDAELPCGSCIRTERFQQDKPGVYLATFSREKRTPIPFYYRDEETNEGRFSNGREVRTWLLSTEIDHLREDDWSVDVHRGFYWQASFNMAEMVNELEKLRYTDTDGPSGALGTIVKALGNTGYGKTLEQLGGIDLVMAKSQPQGYAPYMPEEHGLENVYFRFGETFPRVYHQPQLGDFITGHVRIVVRNGAIVSPKHFLYADTDCLAFSKRVDHLPLDPRKYGLWKQETDGSEYIMITKKVYYGEDEEITKHAKGLHVRELKKEDFEEWFKGKPPTQQQLQRVNFVKFIGGRDMFAWQTRSGTDPTKSKQARLVDREFIPL